MYARTSTWTGSADALEKWVEHVEKSVAPMVAGLAGNAGAFFFADRSGGRALTLTLWDSEDAAAATDLTADQSRDRTVAATGVELEQRGRYAVVGAAGANGGQQRAETSAANKALSSRRRFEAGRSIASFTNGEDCRSRPPERSCTTSVRHSTTRIGAASCTAT